MNAIVVNTLSGAVTEYTGFHFDSVSPKYGGSAAGLFTWGGDTDVGQPIVARVDLPPTLRESTLKKSIQMVYLSMKGEGMGLLTVYGERQNWTYPFPARPHSGQTRCPVGRGIRENYLGLGVSNPDGKYFSIDRVEVLLGESKNRRV